MSATPLRLHDLLSLRLQLLLCQTQHYGALEGVHHLVRIEAKPPFRILQVRALLACLLAYQVRACVSVTYVTAQCACHACTRGAHACALQPCQQSRQAMGECCQIPLLEATTDPSKHWF